MLLQSALSSIAKSDEISLPVASGVTKVGDNYEVS